ncbi:MAG: anion-transporting ArsA/GET3 family ATPase [Myxococcota bacterium]|jgi:anion-transporting  ArsA/GET3 family ATPase
MDLNSWLLDQKLVVCVGSGGVGKTTTAASVGLWAAIQGKKVMVLTIDPAKRLANSLGLEGMPPEGAKIDLSTMPDAKGELWAMMLDSRHTFDDLISRIAPSEEVRDRILANHVYQQMSATFAGSQDYMATERIYDVVSDRDFDIVVLDTPPVKNALDFLESPGRLIKFLDQQVLAWFLEPAKKGLIGSLMSGGSALVLRLLSAVLGKSFIEDLTEFMQDFESLFEGFRDRHDEVQKLFRAEGTTFVTICAPTESSTDVAVFFQEELHERELPRGGVIVNQRHRSDAGTDSAQEVLGEVVAKLSTDLQDKTATSILARLSMAHKRLTDLSTAEASVISPLREASMGGDFYQEVPRLDTEVNDLESLRRIGHHIFAVPAVIP